MSEGTLILRLLGVLVPIFGIVGIGYLYARRHAPEMTAANRLNMDVFVPALVFTALAGQSVALSAHLRLVAGGVLLMAGCALLAWGVARWRGIPERTLVPPMVFNNCGNIGLPLALLAWGEAALPAAVMLFMASNMLHFSLGARYLDRQASVWGIWRIPVVAATALGVLVAVLEIPLWPPLLVATGMMGNISVPLMLFALGVRMTDIRVSEWSLALGSAFLRPLLGMAMAAGLAWALDLTAQESAQLIVFGALPPAVLNFLFAERYQQEPARVASIVLVGNLAALLTLPLALLLVL